MPLVRTRAVALSAILALTASTASAQTPTLERRWAQTSVPLYTQTALPPECDPPTAASANSWNALGSRFVYTGVGQLQSEDTAYIGRVVLRPGPTSTSTAGATTERYPLQAPIGSEMNAARVSVNWNMLFYNGSYYTAGSFNCSSGNASPDQIDYQSMMVHELGHAWGRGHVSDPACVVTFSLYRGETRRRPCANESTQLRATYGVR